MTGMILTKFRYLLMFLLPILLAIVVYSAGTEFLLGKWLNFDHGAYNHGFLLLLVTLYLLYTNINFDSDISKKGNVSGFFLAALFMTVAFAFEVVSIVSLQVVAFYFFIVALVLAIYGWTIFKKALIPLSLLLFALPIWDGVGPFLQKITLDMSYLMVKVAGIPVLKEGYYILIPAGTFEVAPSCSGFSYFMAAFPLAILYAVNNFSDKKNIFLVVGVIVAASIVANWVRVFIIIVAGQMTDMQHYFVTVEHFNLGWLVFGCMFISLVFLFKKVLKDKRRTQYFNSINKAGISVREGALLAGPAFLSSLLLAALAVVFISLQYQVSENNRSFNNNNNDEVAAQLSIPDLFKTALPLYDIKPEFNRAIEHIYIASVYDPPVQLYHGMLIKQGQGKELVSSNNRLFDEARWQLVGEDGGQGSDIRKIELKSKLTGKHYFLWHWYRVDARNTASDMWAKWYELFGYLKGDNSGSIVVLMSPKADLAEHNLNLAYEEIVQ